MDLDALAERLARGGVGTVVATVGTTSMGALDDAGGHRRPVRRARRAAARGHRLRRLLRLLADGGDPGVAEGPYAAIARADSVVIDPHKHGLQPYGCGCVLFADPDVGRLYAHDSPYTYFTSPDLHLGEISLECSRAGASAAALWATLRALPLTREGLGAGLADCRAAALALAERLDADPRIELVVQPELDIVCVRAPGADAERAFASLAAGRLARGHAADRPGHGAALLPAQARAPGRGGRAGRGTGRRRSVSPRRARSPSCARRTPGRTSRRGSPRTPCPAGMPPSGSPSAGS